MVTTLHCLTVSLSSGVMLPWGGQAPFDKPTCIADRFFLGGVSTLRGFKYQGVGPTDARRYAFPRKK
jgi:outer membrane protein insertion porin family